MFRNIQMLRAVAALAVFLFHAEPHYRDIQGGTEALRLAMRYGFVGVDVFFVISGFIMMHMLTVLPVERRGPIDFLGRRFLRIYLWYWPCMLLAMWEFWRFDPTRFAVLDRWGSVTLSSVQMINLAIPVSWSLSYELYFYVLFALVMRWGWLHTRVGMAIAFACLCLGQIVLPPRTGNFLPFFTSPFLLEFFAGCLLYRLRENLAWRHTAPVCLALAAGFFVWGARVYPAGDLGRVQTFGVFSALLVAACVALETNGRFVAGKRLVQLGAASYTVYLIHLAALSLFFHLGWRDALGQTSPWLRELGCAAFVVSLVGVSVLLHQWVEWPMYQAACRLLARRRPLAPVPQVP